MDVRITLSKSQAFLLEWLSKEEWSAYGECRGADLDFLISVGLATCASQPPSDRVGVGLTEAGRAAHVAHAKGTMLGRPWVAPMDELIVYPSRTRAVDAGFGNTGRHPEWPHLTAWWPSKGLQGVMTKRWQRITVSASVHQAEGGAEALRYLRSSQAVFGAAAIWVEV